MCVGGLGCQVGMNAQEWGKGDMLGFRVPLFYSNTISCHELFFSYFLGILHNYMDLILVRYTRYVCSIVFGGLYRPYR